MRKIILLLILYLAAGLIVAKAQITINVDGSGSHGLVSATADQGYYEWGCAGLLIGADAQHTDIGAGDWVFPIRCIRKF